MAISSITNGEAGSSVRTKLNGAIALVNAGWLNGLMSRVDSVNGNDSTAVRGDLAYPYLTLAAAKAAASSGDTIFVGPGTYAVTDSILKNGVNWHFEMGATVTRTNNASGEGILDDEGSAVSCKISGNGVFNMTTNFNAQSGTLAARNASSVIVVECDSIGHSNSASLTGYNLHGCIWAGAGTVYVKCRTLVGSGGTVCGVWWTDGNGYLECDMITATYAVWLHGTAESHFHVRLGRFTPKGSGDIPIYSTAGVAATALWMDVFVLGSDSNLSLSGSIQWSYGKLYLRAQKVFGALSQSGGEVYITVDKWQAAGNALEDATSGQFAWVSAGIAFLNCSYFVPGSYTGPGIVLTGGEVTVNGGTLTCVGETQVSTVTVTAPPNISGAAFIVSLLDGTTRTVWANLDSGGGSGDISYAVTTGDSSDTVAAAIQAAVQSALSAHLTASVLGNVITLTYPKDGPVASIQDGSPASNYAFSSSVTGSTNSGLLVTGGSHVVKHLDISAPDCGLAPVRLTDGTVKLGECSLLGNSFSLDVVASLGTVKVRGCDGSGAGENIQQTKATLISQS